MYFPPGTYYVGDACYVLPDTAFEIEHPPAFWEALGRRQPVTYTWQGFPIWEARTAYGDGSYTDNDGRGYDVDGGRIGLVPLAACDPTKLATLRDDLGHILEFPHGCEPCYDQGIFRFDTITINTR